MVILVMGMHRSGTSALAGLLYAGGIFMGEELVGKSHNNPKGHYEDKRLLSINRKILKSFGGSWRNVPDMRYEELPNDLLSNMKELYQRYASSHEIWGWKDPRMGVTFPVWYKVLRAEKIVFLHIIRKPEEVFLSLEKRDRFTKDQAEGLWAKYNLSIENCRKNWKIDNVVIMFNNLVEDPLKEQRKIERLCGIDLGDGYKFVEKKHKHWNCE